MICHDPILQSHVLLTSISNQSELQIESKYAGKLLQLPEVWYETWSNLDIRQDTSSIACSTIFKGLHYAD